MKIERVKYKEMEQIQHLKINREFKSSFSGSAPAPFIGRVGYPNISVGILSPQYSGDTSYYDSPKLWSKGNFSVGSVASLRFGLVNSKSQGNVKDLSGRYIEMVQEVGIAKSAAEVEITLDRKPSLQLNFEREITPFGPQAKIIQSKITSNVKVNPALEKVFSDTDLKASDGISTLYKKGLEETSISKALSVGAMGQKSNRKLVPTRWSITATDDTISKELLTSVKTHPIGEYTVHFGGGWGNYYLILFFPERFSYELFEMYVGEITKNPIVSPHISTQLTLKYSTDYEDYTGRKSYADNTAGGYYACRLPILEKLCGTRTQCSALALRFITSEYTLPLGVWVCREASRKSLQQRPLIFTTRNEMLHWCTEFANEKFKLNISTILKESLLLSRSSQKNLFEY